MRWIVNDTGEINNTFKYLNSLIVQKSFSCHHFLVRAVGLNITDFFILIVYDTEMQELGFKFSLFLCLAPSEK